MNSLRLSKAALALLLSSTATSVSAQQQDLSAQYNYLSAGSSDATITAGSGTTKAFGLSIVTVSRIMPKEVKLIIQ